MLKEGRSVINTITLKVKEVVPDKYAVFVENISEYKTDVFEKKIDAINYAKFLQTKLLKTRLEIEDS